jgi:hypothetical protein
MPRATLGWSDCGHGDYRAPERITFGDYLLERWLPTKQAQLRLSTFSSYKNNIELHVILGAGCADACAMTGEGPCAGADSGWSPPIGPDGEVARHDSAVEEDRAGDCAGPAVEAGSDRLTKAARVGFREVVCEANQLLRRKLFRCVCG